MCAQWKGEYNVGLLAKWLEKAKNVDNATGDVAFRGFETDDVVSILHSSVEFSKELPELEQRSIIWHSAFSVARAGKITKDALTAEINKRERACALRPTRKFVLTTSLSARYFPLLTRTEVARHRITFSDRPPKRFHEEHEKARERVQDLVFGELPQ
jgi:hypothetical protein